MNQKVEEAKVAMANAVTLFTDGVTKCLASDAVERDGFVRCNFTFGSMFGLKFTDQDVKIFEQLLINLGGFDSIATIFNIPRNQMFVNCYYGGKPVKTRRAKAKKNTRMKTIDVIEKSLWVMKEMYNCLCGMYSEQGEGFAAMFVKDEAKMMNTAEEIIPYMEEFVVAVKNGK